MGSQEYNLYSVPCDNYILHVKYEISDTYRFSYRQSIIADIFRANDM